MGVSHVVCVCIVVGAISLRVHICLTCDPLIHLMSVYYSLGFQKYKYAQWL